MLTKLVFYELQRFALFEINNWLFCSFREKDFFSSFVTLEFKKRQNRNETSLKNGIKFTGIFASLVIKLQTPLLLKVQTRATLGQKMILIKNEQFRTIKKYLTSCKNCGSLLLIFQLWLVILKWRWHTFRDSIIVCYVEFNGGGPFIFLLWKLKPNFQWCLYVDFQCCFIILLYNLFRILLKKNSSPLFSHSLICMRIAIKKLIILVST